MKIQTSRALFLAGAFLAALLAGCATSSDHRPKVAYPVTYDVPFGNTQVSASTGKQDLDVNATQRVEADVGDPLYYQIVSPVPVSVSIYERSSPDSTRRFVRELQGTQLTGSLVPGQPNLEFVFSAPRSNSAGTLRFTLSDKPLARGTTTVKVVE